MTEQARQDRTMSRETFTGYVENLLKKETSLHVVTGGHFPVGANIKGTQVLVEFGLFTLHDGLNAVVDVHVQPAHPTKDRRSWHDACEEAAFAVYEIIQSDPGCHVCAFDGPGRNDSDLPTWASIKDGGRGGRRQPCATLCVADQRTGAELSGEEDE